MTKPSTDESPFAALLTELDSTATVAKAMADEADMGAGGGEEEDEEEHPEDGGEADMAKAITVKLGDGSVVEAIDGTAMMKALNGRQHQMSDAIRSLLTIVQNQNKVIERQGTMLKALGADLRKVAATGTGRRSQVTVHDQPARGPTGTMAKADTVSGDRFFAKAEQLSRAGKLPSTWAAEIEGSRIAGTPINPEVIRGVMEAA
jgi:hypothetical protein